MLRSVVWILLAFSFGSLASGAEPNPRPGLLLTAADVKRHLDDRHVRVVDVRDASAYAAGHVPGAVSVDSSLWTRQSRNVAGLTDREFWAAAVGNLGVDRQTHVTVCGADTASAARAWWLLRFVGVPAVCLLDGGWQAWQAAGYSVEQESSQPEARRFDPDFQRQHLMDMGELLRGRQDPGLQVLDVRSRDEFTGQQVAGARAGRIPGALHLDWMEFLDASGRFKSPAEIKKLVTDAGVKTSGPVVTYCYSGGRASVGVLALELIGRPQVKNYYCSWQEWSVAADTPAESDADQSATPTR